MRRCYYMITAVTIARSTTALARNLKVIMLNETAADEMMRQAAKPRPHSYGEPVDPPETLRALVGEIPHSVLVCLIFDIWESFCLGLFLAQFLDIS
ncbi:hypothetical protein B0T24DRAFT_636989 [Lasiosphaeria ovina]|uniref:Uncharacterized protein n=1 Tax=Lasiosphaeria ovina TaxID=92902 RepID=A0AAE0JY55_9PEZI|nr:hypothetical protein B0T24DRAFT_636989 [Lasiosphaeria ovina]